MIRRNGDRWGPAEDALIRHAKSARPKITHKVIARHLQRTPRSVDQHVARMKQRGLLAMHEREERELLERLLAELDLPSDLA
jgi:DNA-binding MarR family transcriptional regulator